MTGAGSCDGVGRRRRRHGGQRGEDRMVHGSYPALEKRGEGDTTCAGAWVGTRAVSSDGNRVLSAATTSVEHRRHHEGPDRLYEGGKGSPFRRPASKR